MIAKDLPDKEEEAIQPGKRMGTHNQREEHGCSNSQLK